MKTVAALLVVIACALCQVQAAPVTASWHGRTVQIGQPVTFRNLMAFPIEATWKTEVQMNYLTFEEAVEKKLLTIAETAEGTQGDIVFVTSTAKAPVYLMIGDVIISGTPNHIIPGTGGNDWGFYLPGKPNYLVARDTVVSSGAEKLPISVYRMKDTRWRDQSTAGKAQDLKQQDEVARYTDGICSELRKNRRCVGAVYVLNGKVVAADLWGYRALWGEQMPKMARAYATDAANSYETWVAVQPVNIDTAHDAAALLERYERSEHQVVADAGGISNSMVKTFDLLGFDTDTGSSFMHSLIYARRSENIKKPGVLLPRHHLNMLLIPLQVVSADVPSELATRIVQELQIICAQRGDGINVYELLPKSPMIKRALAQLDGDESAQNKLREDYRLAADPTIDADTRRQAAACLVKTFGVDAIVYGAVDRYEFRTNPDRNQIIIGLTVEKVLLDEERRMVSSSLHFEGCSHLRADGRGSRPSHDLEAIMAVAEEFYRSMCFLW